MRARVIIKEITISKQGEVQFFQIRLPKNASRIIGVDTDVFMQSVLEAQGSANGGIPPDKPGTVPPVSEATRTPFLKWSAKSNPTIGKLKLQSADRHQIFFDTWLPFIYLNSGMPDMSYGRFPKSPYSLIRHSQPKPVNVPVASPSVQCCFKDAIGLRKQSDLNYRIKVFLWIETTEKANGVQYDFENKNNSN